MNRNNKRDPFVLLGAIIIVAIVVLAGLGVFIIIAGPNFRISYIDSIYKINLYTDGDLNNFEIMVPLPAQDVSLDDHVNMEIENTPYGAMIQLFSASIEEGGDWLYYSEKLVGKKFSTQENQTIWIYSNFTNNTKPVRLVVIKEDRYLTLNILEDKIEYTGTLTKHCPSRFGSYAKRSEYISEHAVELIQGWNQYTLKTGTYNQYED